jgi:hypothetical protein
MSPTRHGARVPHTSLGRKARLVGRAPGAAERHFGAARGRPRQGRHVICHFASWLVPEQPGCSNLRRGERNDTGPHRSTPRRVIAEHQQAEDQSIEWDCTGPGVMSFTACHAWRVGSADVGGGGKATLPRPPAHPRPAHRDGIEREARACPRTDTSADTWRSLRWNLSPTSRADRFSGRAHRMTAVVTTP